MPLQLRDQSASRRHLLVLLALFAVTAALATKFIGWPLNRDITTYATIAQELLAGKKLYTDVWDIKPPGIYSTYLAVQWLIPAKEIQIFILSLVPTLVVLTALYYSARPAGFGPQTGVWAGLFWIAFSGNTLLQTQEPNVEIFINACCAVAFLQLLCLRSYSSWARPVGVGLLFGLACLYKTVAITIPLSLAAAYLLSAMPGTSFQQRVRQLALMAVTGALALATVVGYFAVTGRFAVFREVMVEAGGAYAGNVGQNVIRGITFAPVAGDNLLLQCILASGPWLLIAAVAALDGKRRRSWVLLAAYAFGSLLALALPGKFYAHYFQFLLPPFCLGIGWATGLAALLPWPPARKVAPILAGLLLAGVCVHQFSTYRSRPAEAVAGKYQELYLRTEAMAQRLGSALRDDEVLYQWGEESGLYWHSGKRPTAAVLTFPLLSGPQAGRLTNDTLRLLQERPPDLIIAVNYMLDRGTGHPVFEWIRTNYTPAEPVLRDEREFFTFFLPASAEPEFVRRVLGADTAAVQGTAASN